MGFVRKYFGEKVARDVDILVHLGPALAAAIGARALTPLSETMQPTLTNTVAEVALGAVLPWIVITPDTTRAQAMRTSAAVGAGAGVVGGALAMGAPDSGAEFAQYALDAVAGASAATLGTALTTQSR